MDVMMVVVCIVLVWLALRFIHHMYHGEFCKICLVCNFILVGAIATCHDFVHSNCVTFKLLQWVKS